MESTFSLEITLEGVVYTTHAGTVIGGALIDAGIKCRIMDRGIIIYDSLSETKTGEEE